MDKDGCPVCAVMEKLERLKKEKKDERYCEILARLTRQTFDRLSFLHKLRNASGEGFPDTVDLVIPTGTEVEIMKIEEKNKQGG
jgi:hypothetical protein